MRKEFSWSNLSVEIRNRRRQRETLLRTHFEAHFSLRWRTRGLKPSTDYADNFLICVICGWPFAKHRVHHPLKTPCLHLAKSISIVKKLKERALSFPGKLPAPSILVNFVFEIWEREAAPAELLPDITAIYGHLLSEFAA